MLSLNRALSLVFSLALCVGDLQRKIGLKTIEVGGNSVVGYVYIGLQCTYNATITCTITISIILLMI